MRTGRAFAVAGCALLGFTLVAAAQEPPAGDGAGRNRAGREERRGGRLAEYLGLDAQQKAAVQKLHQQQREEMKPLWEEGRELRRKLREATDADKPDALAVGEATLAVKAHHERVKAQRAAFDQKLAALLTPEQKQKYEALKAARAFGRDSRRGGRQARPAGPRGEL